MSNNEFEYEIKDNDEIKITRYTGKEEAECVIIPSKINGKAVTAVGSNCFKDNGVLVCEIVVPDSVTTIEEDAFAYAVSMESLKLPESIEKIGEDFLLATALEEICIPANVKHIERPETLERKISVSPKNPYFFADDYGLYEKKEDGRILLIAVNSSDTRNSYRIDDRATGISIESIRNAGHLNEIIIPKGLSEIPEGALSFTGNRASDELGVIGLKVEEGNTKFFVDGDCVYERLDESGLKLLRFFKGDKLNLLPDTKLIAKEACKNTALESIYFPSEEVRIHENAFKGTRLKYAYFKDSINIFFGYEDLFTLAMLLEGFESRDKTYDFTKMDNFLMNEYLSEGRVKMMVNRILNPRDLADSAITTFKTKINNEFYYVLDILAKEKDISTIEGMGKLEFFNESNIDDIIDKMNTDGHKELTAWFMSFKNSNIKSGDNLFLL